MQAGPVSSAPTATSPPLFLGEHRALDFLNTLAAPAGEVVEWVGTGEDLVDWLVAAELVPGEVAQRWRGARARGSTPSPGGLGSCGSGFARSSTDVRAGPSRGARCGRSSR